MTDAVQILAELRPIHMPPDLAANPPVEMALLGFLAALIVSAALRPWLSRRRALRRSAFDALALSRSLTPEERLVAQAAILRRLVETINDSSAARQQGEIWLACLDRTFSTRFFGSGAGRIFADALYRPLHDLDLETLDGSLAEIFERITR